MRKPHRGGRWGWGDWYPEEKRERLLSAAELRRVGEVLCEMKEEGIEFPSAIAAVRLLILT